MTSQQQSKFIYSPLVLDFYQLDTWFPEVWSVTQPAKNEIAAMPHEMQPEFMRKEFQVQGDPLGLTPSFKQLSNKNKRRPSQQPSPSAQTIEGQLQMTSPYFNSKQYLLQTHSGASFEDLEKGLKHLKQTVEVRNETLKSLVKEHFDRFVGAKSTVDAVYKELKEREMKKEGYGVGAFQQKLEEIQNVAEKIFRPIMDRKKKVDQIRSTLDMLERYQFFFNLPASLEELIYKQKYDQAVRDYQKGKSIMMATVQTTSMSSSPVAQQREESIHKIFEKVWQEVLRLMSVLRVQLFQHLSDPSNGHDVQERHISFLLELDGLTKEKEIITKEQLDDENDPVWFYLKQQHQWMFSGLRQIYQEFTEEMELCLDRFIDRLAQEKGQFETKEEEIKPEQSTNLVSPVSPKSQNPELLRKKNEKRKHQLLSLKFRKALHAIHMQEFESIFGKEVEVQTWHLLLKFQQRMDALLRKWVPDYSKVVRNYLDEKYATGRGPSADRKLLDKKKVDMAHVMLQHVFNTYSLQLQTAFGFLMGHGQLDRDFSFDLTHKISEFNLNQYLETAAEKNSLLEVPFGKKKLSVSSTVSSMFASSLTRQTPPSTLNRPPVQPLQKVTVTNSDEQLEEEEPEPTVAALPPPPQEKSPMQIYLSHLREEVTCSGYFFPIFLLKLSGFYHFLLKHVKPFGSNLINKQPSSLDSSFQSGELNVNQMLTTIQQLLDKLKRQSIETLCHYWIQTSALFYAHENWLMDSEIGDQTQLLKLFMRFQKFLLKSLFQCLTLTDWQQLKHGHEQKRIILNPQWMEWVQDAFMESQLVFLDGIYFLGKHPTAWYDWTCLEEEYLSNGKVGLVDPSKESNRYLLFYNHLLHLNQQQTPNLIYLFEQLFKQTLDRESKKIYAVQRHLQSQFLELFLLEKSRDLSHIVQQGLLLNGLDWKTDKKAEVVQGYVHQCLMALVLVHSQVQKVLGPASMRPIAAFTPPEEKEVKPSTTNSGGSVMHTILFELIQSLLNTFLQCLKRIDYFSIEGGKQALLDLYALQQVLNDWIQQYEPLKSLIKILMGVIEEGVERYERKRVKKTFGMEKGEWVHQQMTFIEGVVKEWIKGSDVVYICLKEIKY